MAVRRKKVEPVVIEPVESVVENKCDGCCCKKGGCKKCGFVALLVVALVVGWWWKTNTWPIVAIVDGRIITRYEVDKSLFSQGGSQAVEDMIIQKAVEAEIAKLKLTPSSAEIEAKLASVRKGLPAGTQLETLLSGRGMTVNEFKKQLGLRMAIEKAVMSQVNVASDEIASYVKDNGASLTASDAAGKAAEAETALKAQKLQALVGKWIEDVRTKAKVMFWKSANTAPATQ
jgi:hypothetical protein